MEVFARTLAASVLVGAFVLPAPSAAGVHAVPRRTCSRTFSAVEFRRTVERVYRGVRLPPRGSYGLLWAEVRCPRPPSTEVLARTIWARLLRAWEHRRHALIVRTSSPSALVLCILWRESTSTPSHLNAGAVNASGHEGIAQWDANAWATDGGLQYAPTPLGATGPEQLAVLEHAAANPSVAYGQWREWDGC